ncbi:8-amino-7-oxononanoate synthase [Thiomicrorhabdus sp. zzn3]|uniref:8-amino-7-oxononanoate synthase n=1 Tax=Thiomicrorhabdus sp. zzn3 TaxID=3039775 RepID=UPI002436C75B|nr:8-amino-7-oxononanoate synthase [Thiomicrorhabdus sp. zzn3]MDG6778891.1 8-amino-7-oxononanoate synthase [Thiomicrorhabdus sp. zzn3]
MPQSIQQRFTPLLEARRQAHLYRQRPLSFSAQQPQMQINGLPMVNFSSNDYLGFANHPQIKHALIDALQNDDLSYGSGAAHLVSGHHLHHHLLEDEIADWLGVERALLFSTGYMANLAVQQVLMQPGDTLLGDKLNHASLIDGARHCAAEFKRYPHRDMNALQRRLEQIQPADGNQVLIATDGVFSMDGDIAPLAEIQRLAQAHQTWLLVDDAHGFGMLGQDGRGSFDYLGLKPSADTVLVGTLGKAFGTSGAFVAGSEVLIESLIQFARPYIYTTAMSPLNALATREALKLVKQGDPERQRLQAHIQRFREGALALRLELWDSPSAIQPILLGDSETALQWSEALKQQGFWVAAIRPPTVPKGQARLRVTLSAAHTEEQVDALLQALKQIQANHKRGKG